MAIGIHIVDLERNGESHVVSDHGAAPNRGDGTRTVDAYLALEAAANFLPTVLTEFKCVTVSASDVNGA